MISFIICLVSRSTYSNDWSVVSEPEAYEAVTGNDMLFPSIYDLVNGYVTLLAAVLKNEPISGCVSVLLNNVLNNVLNSEDLILLVILLI